MQAHYRTPLTSYEIAELAYLVERQDLGIAGGLQDQYAATFGGFNFIEFHADHVVVNPLRIDDETVRELEHNLLLVDTGRTRMSDHIIADQTSRYLGGEPGAIDALRRQKQLAVEMKNALLQRRPRVFGELLDEAWHEKRRMSPRIATGYIDDAYEAAKAAQERNTPLRKAGTPEDMAQAAVWFIEGADLITGEILIVDAGSHLGGAPLIAR